MKRVLVIGNTSVLGLALTRALATDMTVTLAGRNNSKMAIDLGQNLHSAILNTRYDTVVNVAAYFGTQQPHEMLEAVRVNAFGALNVCVLAQAVRARHIIQISSVSASYEPQNSHFDAYALTKRQGDELCQLFCTNHLIPLTVLRPTQLYDETGAARKHQRMFYHMLDQASAGRDITIFGRRDPSRNYMFMADFVEVCRRVIETGVTGTFSVAHPRAHRLSEIAALAYKCFGTSGNILFDHDRSDLDDIEAQMDAGLADAIGYVPATSLAEGIEHFRRHEELKH